MNETVYIKPCWYRDPFGNKCGNYGMKQEEVLNEVYTIIHAHVDDLKYSVESGQNLVQEEKRASLENEVDVIDKQINQLHQKRERIISMIESGILSIEEGKLKINDVNTQFERLQTRRDMINYEIETLFSRNIESELVSFEEVISTLKGNISDEHVNTLLRSIIKEIKYEKTINDERTLEISFL